MFRGSSSEVECSGAQSGYSGGCSRRFDSEPWAVMGAGEKSESVAGGFGGRVLQEPELPAGRAASPGSLFCIVFESHFLVLIQKVPSWVRR